MNLSLSQAVEPFPGCRSDPVLFEVGAPMRRTFLCLEVTDSPKSHVPRLLMVFRLRFPIPHQPTVFLSVAFWADHLALEVQPIHLGRQGKSWAPMPIPQVELFVCLTNLLGTVAPAILSGNRVQQLRSDAATNVFHRNSKWKHQLFWTMNMHSVLRLAFPCTERYPCPMKLPKHQTTLHLDVPIDCAMGLLSLFETVASTPILLTEWQCVVDAMFSRLITCALSCMLIWKTRTDIWCART